MLRKLFSVGCYCGVQYVIELLRLPFGAEGGEYRNRTDDLLHAMQAL